MRYGFKNITKNKPLSLLFLRSSSQIVGPRWCMSWTILLQNPWPLLLLLPILLFVEIRKTTTADTRKPYLYNKAINDFCLWINRFWSFENVRRFPDIALWQHRSDILFWFLKSIIWWYIVDIQVITAENSFDILYVIMTEDTVPRGKT